MTPIDPNVERLAALTGYLEYILNEFPAPQGEAQEDPLILILVCLQKTLERRIAKTAPTPIWLNAMRWALNESRVLLDKIYDFEYEQQKR